MTTEAAYTKLSYLLGNSSDKATVKYLMAKNLRGELSRSEKFFESVSNETEEHVNFKSKL